MTFRHTCLAVLVVCCGAQASTSEHFFAAYQLAQISGLAKTLTNQAKHPDMVAQTAAQLQHQTGQVTAQEAATQSAYQHTVLNFINSKQAGDYFDSLATELLATTYSYEELKALYQLYNAPAVQSFIGEEIDYISQQHVQTYLARKTMNQQLADKTAALLDQVNVMADTATDTEVSLTAQPGKAPLITAVKTKALPTVTSTKLSKTLIITSTADSQHPSAPPQVPPITLMESKTFTPTAGQPTQPLGADAKNVVTTPTTQTKPSAPTTVKSAGEPGVMTRQDDVKPSVSQIQPSQVAMTSGQHKSGQRTDITGAQE